MEFKENLSTPAFCSIEEQQTIFQLTGWSNSIIQRIHSIKEAQIYIEANLKEINIDGKTLLVKNALELTPETQWGFWG